MVQGRNGEFSITRLLGGLVKYQDGTPISVLARLDIE